MPHTAPLPLGLLSALTSDGWFSTCSPALQAELLKVGDKMTAEWVEKAGADGQAILDAYRKLK